MNERLIQAALMRWLMREKKHVMILPNTKLIRARFESDLISITKSGLAHEYEIKISLSDFRRDIKKLSKHEFLDLVYKNKEMLTHHTPSYFWYVTAGFDLDPDELMDYAGWIEIKGKTEALNLPSIYDDGSDNNLQTYPDIIINKPAPRLHTQKIGERKRAYIYRGLSFRLSDLYRDLYLQDWEKEFNNTNEEKTK